MRKFLFFISFVCCCLCASFSVAMPDFDGNLQPPGEVSVDPVINDPVPETDDDSGNAVSAPPALSFDFSGAFRQIGVTFARQFGPVLGLGLGVFFAVNMLTNSVLRGMGLEKGKKSSGSAEERVLKRLDSDLKIWGGQRGYSVREIKRNHDLYTQYYNDRYGNFSG